jgi:predicted dehydrogenase
MSSKLRIGIVGADANGQGWAPLAHLPALRALPEYDLVAVCTAHADTARAAAERYGIPHAYHDYRTMFSHAELDVVSVVVRAPNHLQVVTEALKAGKHVYCEWPLGVDTPQAEEMAVLARERGVRAVVGLQARCDPTLRYARQLIAEGFVGDVLSVTMGMMSPGLPERSRGRIWEARTSGGVSALTIRAMHSLEALSVCVGELREISARVSTQVKQWRVIETGEMVDVEVPDDVVLAGTLANGAAVSAHIATVPSGATGFRMEILGRDGALTISTSGAPQRDANTLVGARGRDRLAPMAVPAGYDEVPAGTPAGPPHNVAHLYRRLARGIVAGSEVEPSFDHALARHRLIDAIAASSRERRWVPIA